MLQIHHFEKKALLAKGSFLLTQIILFFPFVFYPIRNGLDSSWQYELNLLAESESVFGCDLLFTYGPLGYLFVPQNIGNHIFLSWLVLGFLYLLTLFASIYVLFSRRFAAIGSRHSNILASAALLSASFLAGFYNPEYWIAYMVFFLLSATLWEKNASWMFFTALALTVFFLFVKFSSGILNTLTAILFLVAAFALNHPCIKKMSLSVMLGMPALFAICYFLYCPDLESMVRYVYAALNISSGYTYNMSIPVTDDTYLCYVFALLFLLGAGILWMSRYSLKNLFYAIMFSGEIFIVLKHGLVRGDSGHLLFVGPVLFMLASLFILFMDTSLDRLRLKKSVLSIFFTLSCCLAVVFPVYYWNIRHEAQPFVERVYAAWSLPHQLSNMDTCRDERTKLLTKRFHDAVKGSSVAFYPWEIAYYSTEDDITFRPIPVFPINSCTPYLDHYNAVCFSSNDAPEFVVLSLDVIDNQYPLVNCPELWRSLFIHYNIMDYDGHNFLLQRMPGNTALYETETVAQVQRDDSITLPPLSEDEHLIIKADATRNLKGRLAQIFYKIPEVNMTVAFDNGETITKRIFFEVWQNGIIIDMLPVTDGDFRNIMSNRPGRRVRSLRFTGDGLSYYQDGMTISYIKFRAKKIPSPAALPKAPETPAENQPI